MVAVWDAQVVDGLVSESSEPSLMSVLSISASRFLARSSTAASGVMATSTPVSFWLASKNFLTIGSITKSPVSWLKLIVASLN